jgi:hypothetical protein
MTEEINYKELCEEFYKSLKNFRGTLSSNQTNVLEKYEDLHKPKMTRDKSYGGGVYDIELVNYDKQQYALFWNNWYILESGKLYQVVSERCIDELNEAYKEYKNQK